MLKTKDAISLVVLTATLSGASASAHATDLPVYTKAPSVEAPVQQWIPWMVRLRVLGVLPDNGGSTAIVAGSDALSSPYSGLSVSNEVAPELDVSYFFTKNIGAELALGATRLSVNGTGALNGLQLERTTLLTPTLTLQYHYLDFGAFKPYVGVGFGYAAFVKTHAAEVCNADGLWITKVHNVNTFDGVVQFGFDYMLGRHWAINVDVKKLWLRPDYTATINSTTLGAIHVNGTAHIDPWLVGAGIAYKF